MKRFRSWYWVALATVLVAISVVAVASGAVAVPLAGVIDALQGTGDPTAVAIEFHGIIDQVVDHLLKFIFVDIDH